MCLCVYICHVYMCLCTRLHIDKFFSALQVLLGVRKGMALWSLKSEKSVRKEVLCFSLSTKDYPQTEGIFIAETCLSSSHLRCPFFSYNPFEKRQLSLFGRLVFKTDTVKIHVLFYLHQKSQGDSGRQ